METMKKSTKIIIWIAAVAIVGLGATYFARNWLVERAIEAGCTYALGVDTELGGASVDLGGGCLKLNNLEIYNPEGFEAERFLRMRLGVFDLNAGSIFDDQAVVDSFVIEGITLNLEQVGAGGNYAVLMDNIKKVDMSAFSSKEETKYRIGLVAVRDIQVKATLSILGKNVEKTFAIESFTMRNVGGDKGATIGGIIARIVQSIVSKALSAAGGLFTEGFGKAVHSLQNKAEDAVKSEVAGQLKGLGKSLTGARK
jgi:hypothetical protein